MRLSTHDSKSEVIAFSRSDAMGDLAAPKRRTWGPRRHDAHVGLMSALLRTCGRPAPHLLMMQLL